MKTYEDIMQAYKTAKEAEDRVINDLRAKRDKLEAAAETISAPTRAKAQTYQDKPAADTLPDDLPADVLKFYEVNRDASDENPAPVCLFWHNNTHSYTAYGSDAHILRDELGKVCATFTTETEYKHGKHYPAPIDYADIERDELPAALHWLTREGYAVAVFAFADCLPTLCPAAPNWQERAKARRDLRYSERLELADGVTREEESRRNIYDGHYNIQYRYYKNGELLAIFNATGYPEKWDVISTLRPPYAGHFSTGSNAAYFGTIYEAQKFMLSEIAKGLQPYHKPTDPTPEPSGEGVGICHSFDTNQDTATLQCTGEITDTADPLADIIREARKAEKWSANGKWNYGPIDYLKAHVVVNTETTKWKDYDESLELFADNLHRVTDPETYCVSLITDYDIFVDEDYIVCAMHRAFPAVGFREVCKMIADNMGDHQQGNGISPALVPDVVIIQSEDKDTRETFRKRHDKFCKLSSYWKGEEVNTRRERDLRTHYDRESLAVHFLLSHELFYSWTDNRHREDCLRDVRVIYPDMTADELHTIRDKYAPAISEIYG